MKGKIMLDLLKLKNEVSETTDSIEPDDVYNKVN